MSNTTQPLVSVCIPSYNHETFIEKTIQSVIGQDYQNIELFIIDDCSDDNSWDIIQKYNELCQQRFINFVSYKNSSNKGLSKVLNTAINIAKGKYFYVIASDDILMPFKTSLLVAEIEKLDGNYAAIFGDAFFINFQNQMLYADENMFRVVNNYNDNINQAKTMLELNSRIKNIDLKAANFRISYENMLGGNYLPAMSSLIKLNAIKKVKGYTNDNRLEDYEMWLKLLQKYKIALITKPVALYRIHEKNSFATRRNLLQKDELVLLQKQKTFAIKNGYEKLFYQRITNLILLVAEYDYQFAKTFADLNNIEIR